MRAVVGLGLGLLMFVGVGGCNPFSTGDDAVRGGRNLAHPPSRPTPPRLSNPDPPSRPGLPRPRSPDEPPPIGGVNAPVTSGPRELLDELAQDGNSAREAVCFGVGLADKDALPLEPSSFAELLAAHLIEQGYEQTTQGRAEQIYELLEKLDSGDIFAVSKDLGCL